LFGLVFLDAHDVELLAESVEPPPPEVESLLHPRFGLGECFRTKLVDPLLRVLPIGAQARVAQDPQVF
jgi:hypothetical protein